MKFSLIICILFSSLVAWSAQKATIIGDVVEIYSKADFDSDIIAEVHAKESYLISNQTEGPFYRIKLKDNRIGYIVDYELNIAGKGTIKPKDLDVLEAQEMAKASQKALPDPFEIDESSIAEDSNDEEDFLGKSYSGILLQMFNYREDVYGAVRTDNIFALGYKASNPIYNWSLLGSYGVPKYYKDVTLGDTNGFQLWGDISVFGQLKNFGRSEIKVGIGLFAHFYKYDIKATSENLQNMNAGLNLELAWLYKVSKEHAIELGIKYYFDKEQYSALALAYLF